MRGVRGGEILEGRLGGESEGVDDTALLVGEGRMTGALGLRDVGRTFGVI